VTLLGASSDLQSGGPTIELRADANVLRMAQLKLANLVTEATVELHPRGASGIVVAEGIQHIRRMMHKWLTTRFLNGL